MLKKDRSQKQRAVSASVAAPVGGWNARDSLGDMAITDAVSMINFFPSTTTVNLRDGYTEHFEGGGAQFETLMAYHGGSADELWALNTSGKAYNVTSGGTIGNYLNFPSPASLLNYVQTPDSAAISITGDMDVRVYMQPDDWTPAADYGIINKFNRSGNQVSWNLRLLPSGILRFRTSPDGTVASAITSSSTASLSYSDGLPHWVRATVDVDNGSSGNTVAFYTSDDGTTWTQLGASVVNAGTTSIFDSTAPIQVGLYENTPPTGGFAGKVLQAQIYDGIAGTLVAECDPNDAAVGATTIVSATTGETWTLNGSATIANDSDLSGLANGRFQYVNFATSGGQYIVMCNGADDVYNYDGSTWTTPSITGVTSSTLNNVNIHKSRLWFIQNDSLKAWYLPTQSISGAANALDLSAYCPHGGYLVAMGTWTLDAGYGVDDMAVFITSQGDCLVYRGTDPSSATTWALVGVWWIGSPIGKRCFVKHQGDMLIICEDGLFQLSGALQSSRTNPKVALTDKIQQQMSNSVSLYRNNFGWQVIPFPEQNMVILNVPTQQGQMQEQYVMNTITGAWCQFQGWDANCWELFNDGLYFGGDGFVGRAWYTNADNGEDIDATCQQAFNYFKRPGQKKRFTMMRPTLFVNGNPDIQGALNVDFNTMPPTSNITTFPVSGALWDTSLWDSGIWSETLSLSNSWQGVTGIGYSGGVRLDSSTNGIQLQWVATDIVMEPGKIL